jgi:hypothetical protein
MTLFADGRAPPQLVEEVFEETASCSCVRYIEPTADVWNAR